VKMRWYFCFFLISGFCSLVYEVVWLRLSMAEFGVTVTVTSIVLSMFMAGLGLGSWGAGLLLRLVRELTPSSALRFYALTELLIGISAFVVPHELRLGHSLLLRMGGAATWESSAYYVSVGVWLAATMIPWCSCMGATFPLLMAAIRQTPGADFQRSFSYLYIANTLGALLGTFLPAFLLIELLGFLGTLHIASILNAVVAVSALLVSLSTPLFRSWVVAAAERFKPRKLYGLPEGAGLWMLFTTGLVSMAMEMVWIRQFTIYVGNVVYAFATILAIYLLATYVGSCMYRRWVRSHTPQKSTAVWTALGLLGLMPLAAADPLLASLLFSPFSFVIGVLRVAVGIGTFCGCLGFLTPMLVDHWAAGDPDRAGKAYTVNVLGCILGPLLAGFYLLPRLGERWALVALTVPLFVFGALATTHKQQTVDQPGPDRNGKLYYALAIVAALLVVMTTHGYEALFPKRVVRRDHTATVLATGVGLDKDLLVNGIGMTYMTPITKYMAHLPLAFMQRPPNNGLVVCFGMGTTFRSMLSWGIPTTAVDLVPSVPAMFGYFHPDAERVLASPQAQIVVDDGRRFLDGSTLRYDVITVDPPPPPAAPGSSLLYSQEFYAIVKRHLAAGGVVQVWYPEDGTDPATSASIAKALVRSFPHVRAFQSVEGWGIHYLASMEALSSEPASVLAARFPPRAAADLVEWGPESTAEEQLSDVLAHEQEVRNIIALDSEVPPLEDDQPINEYFALRQWFQYYR